MSELDGFMENLSAKLDSTSTHLIKQILEVNGFTTRLSIKLISEKHLELRLQGVDLTMGAKRLFNYHIQVLRDESPLQLKWKDEENTKMFFTRPRSSCW